MPSYVNVNMGAEEKSVEILNLCLEHMKGLCRQVHRWLFTSDMIRSYRFVVFTKKANFYVVSKKFCTAKK